MEAGKKKQNNRDDEGLIELEADVEELREQLRELELEKEKLIKSIHHQQPLGAEGTSDEARQEFVNWKWIQEATKFSGVSVFKCGPKFCTFHFHPMYDDEPREVYSMTVDLKKNGDYLIGKSYLPESITVADLDSKKPLDELVWDVSNLVDSFVNRQQQVRQIEETFGEGEERTVSYSADFLRVILRVKVTDPSDSSTNGYFMVDIKLDYNSDEILPKAVEFEMDNDGGAKKMTTEDFEEFESHCAPFYQLPLLEAFRSAFN